MESTGGERRWRAQIESEGGERRWRAKVESEGGKCGGAGNKSVQVHYPTQPSRILPVLALTG